MKIVVVGGHSRNIGKTSVIVGLIRGLKSLGWTAVKITEHRHAIRPNQGGPCEPAPGEKPFVLAEETNPRGHGDTCRFLAAGARRSLWLRVRKEHFEQALPSLFEALDGDEHVIIESNSILGFLQPTVYVVVLDSSCRDFKVSARRYLYRADVFVAIAARMDARSWPELNSESFGHKRVFPLAVREYSNPELCRFIECKLLGLDARLRSSDSPPSSPDKEQPWQH